MVLQFGFRQHPDVALAALRLHRNDVIILVLGITNHWQGRADPEHPDLHVADAIIAAIAEVGLINGAKALRLRAREGNLRAIAAYRRCGFRVIATFSDSNHGSTVEMMRML